MNQDTSGPAFPTGTGGNTPYCMGMTLRDYFAAKAMQAMCEEVSRYNQYDGAARDAYRMADAMLEARE